MQCTSRRIVRKGNLVSLPSLLLSKARGAFATTATNTTTTTTTTSSSKGTASFATFTSSSSSSSSSSSGPSSSSGVNLIKPKEQQQNQNQNQQQRTIRARKQYKQQNNQQRHRKQKHREEIQHQQHQHKHQHQHRSSIKYGTITTIRTTPLPHPPNHLLTPYIQHSIQTEPTKSSSSSQSQNIHQNQKQSQNQNSFNITFLGTGCGNISTRRNASSTALKIDGTTFLFDAGEGANKQLSHANTGTGTDSNSLPLNKISKIFITHLHIDHVGGLITLLLNIKLSAVSSYETNKRKIKIREKEKERNEGQDDNNNVNVNVNVNGDDQLTLEVYGPVGLYNYIAMNLTLTHSNIYPMKIIVHELVDEYDHDHDHEHDHEHDKDPQRKSQKKRRRSSSSNFYRNKIFHGEYREIQNRNRYLERRFIYKNPKSDTWIIQKPEIEKRNELIASLKENPGRNVHKYSLIEAAQVDHVPQVQTFGYVVTEPAPQPKIDVQRATALGVEPSPKYRLLKIGQSVLNDDGTEMVHPHQVLCSDGDAGSVGNGNGGRKFVLIGDTCSLSDSMVDISQGCDVLIHEATLSEDLQSESKRRGHSTATMAGKVAKRVNAKALILNHISGSQSSQQEVDELVQSAESVCGGCPVVAAYDFMEFSIPRNGFNFTERKS